jgi:hypothetical protein
MDWERPLKVDELLDSAFNPGLPRPPLEPSVYIVSRLPWQTEPTLASQPLYVGGLLNDWPRFRTRIGDLVADMFGFFGEVGKKGHHSGGQSLHRYCIEKGLSPRDLYIGWAKNIECHRCAEIAVYDRLSPLLNKNRPAACEIHGSA